MLASLLLVLLPQQPAPPPAPAAPRPAASPIARAVIQPAEAAVLVGDTLRLKVVAYDSAGQVYPGATATWFATGGMFEGSVEGDGLVTAGAVGTLTVSALVRPSGGAKDLPSIKI